MYKVAYIQFCIIKRTMKPSEAFLKTKYEHEYSGTFEPFFVCSEKQGFANISYKITDYSLITSLSTLVFQTK